MKNNKLMVYVLGALVIMAIIWRIANPPEPIPPGPLGKMPNWNSMVKVGDMGPAAVSPDGKMWAGVWNEKKGNKLNSAVWIFDLEKDTVKNTTLKEGLQAKSIKWKDDNTLQVSTTKPGGCDGFNIKTDTDKLVKSKANDLTPVGFDSHIAAGTVISVGCPHSKWRVFTGMKPADTGKFGLFDTSGPGKDPLVSDKIPGRIENIWASDSAVLVVAVERERIHRIIFGIKDNKLSELKDSNIDVAKTWPDAPKNMMFVNYKGGYDLNLRTGKVKRLFKFDTSDKSVSSMAVEIGDGRLYPRKDGGYTSVSYAANAVDIRALKEDGTLDHNILPRK